jgi:hypothetical protein
MLRAGHFKKQTKGGWLLASFLHATDKRTVSRAFLFCWASMLLLNTSTAPISRVILQQREGVCQGGSGKNIEVRK